MRTRYATALLCCTLLAAAPGRSAITSSIHGGHGAFYSEDIDAGPFSEALSFATPRSGRESVDISYFIDGLSGFKASFNNMPIIFMQQPNGTFHGSLTSVVLQGPQTLNFSGNSDGTGSFSGNVVLSAVPEPTSWGLAILGLGVAGAVRRRRTSGRLVVG